MDIFKNRCNKNKRFTGLKNFNAIKKIFFKHLLIYKIIFLFSILFFLIIFKVYSLKKEKETIINEKPSWSIINDEFLTLVHKYKGLIKREKKIKDNSPIWVMWYQKIENAPPIVKACIKSIIINSGKHPVYILDQNNFSKYISLPSFIMEKFNRGIFSITHFSDILRMGLLAKYGGYWIDSTYLITSPLITVNSSLFTLKLKHCFPSITKCLWAGNFLAVSKNSFIATYAYKSFLKYWKKYNSLINYFLIDYIIYIAYQNVHEFRNLISNLPLIKCNIFTLCRSLNKNFNKAMVSCPFNKLSKKVNGTKFNNSIKTVYGYIIDKYKLN